MCERMAQTNSCGTLRTGCVAASIMFRAAVQPPIRALDDALPREKAPISLDARLGELERSLITWALTACDGKVSRAAELLQIKRSTLQDRMRRYQFDPGSELQAVQSDLTASA